MSTPIDIDAAKSRHAQREGRRRGEGDDVVPWEGGTPPSRLASNTSPKKERRWHRQVSPLSSSLRWWR